VRFKLLPVAILDHTAKQFYISPMSDCGWTSIILMRKMIPRPIAEMAALLAFAAAVALPAVLRAEDYTYATNRDNTITISGYRGSGGDLVIPDTLGGGKVTSIGNRAFYDFASLTSVTIPSSVTTIQDWAFHYCTSLTNVTIANGTVGQCAFQDCLRLTSVALGDGVTSIGRRAFQNCIRLTDVTIGSGVTNGGNCFFASASLTSITVHASNPAYSSVNGVLFDKNQATLMEYPGGKAEGSYTLPGSVTAIGDSAFQNAIRLTSVPIPGNVTRIGNLAFAYCTSLTNVSIPASVTNLGTQCFAACVKLPSVTIPDNITGIGLSTFASCTSLTSVRIGSGVTNIGETAFAADRGLTGVYFKGSAPSVGKNAFAPAPKLTVFYLPGTTGWSNSFCGHPTAIWNLESNTVPNAQLK